jgi:hypothetical protein
MGVIHRLSKTSELMSFDRDFSVWAFTVSHSQLLLRSPKAGTAGTRVDIGFSGVIGFIGGVDYPGLAIRPSNDSEIDALTGFVGLKAVRSAEAAYALVGVGGHSGFVLANSCEWAEDEGDFSEPSQVFLPTATLSGLARPDDWPSVEEVRSRFRP